MRDDRITPEFLQSLGFGFDGSDSMRLRKTLDEPEDDHAGVYVAFLLVNDGQWTVEICPYGKPIWENGVSFGCYRTKTEVIALCALMGVLDFRDEEHSHAG